MRSATTGGTKGSMSPPICGDLPDKRGGDVAGLRARRQENRLQPGRHRAVHAGHLHLVVEVGAVAQPADQDRRADLAREIDDQIVEGAGLDLDARRRAQRRRRPSRSARAGRRPKASAPSTDARRSRPPACRRAGTPPSSMSTWPLVSGSNVPG